MADRLLPRRVFRHDGNREIRLRQALALLGDHAVKSLGQIEANSDALKLTVQPNRKAVGHSRDVIGEP